jgi:hypothetical protein
MIRYRDFVPKSVKGNWLQGESYEDFDAAVSAANAWLEAENIEVEQLETVVLPNITDPGEEGSADGAIDTISGWARWHQFLRVWYRGS